VILPPGLVKAIDTGRCFALVGSGPSCEVGYPSWRRLAENLLQALRDAGRALDEDSYAAYLSREQYPELFQLAEQDAGGRSRLVDLLKVVLLSSSSKEGQIYNILVNLPFACYLTTNYDDEIKNRLDALGLHYTVVQNRVSDFKHVRDGASHLIVKLHSDLNHPDQLVITAADYKRLAVDDQGNYFRVKLRAIMEMFNVLIIGHSLSDIDFKIVLQAAKQTSNTKKPIYMIAAGFSRADERLFFQNYNIELIRYDNPDGKHEQLKRLLTTADRFIDHREKRADLDIGDSGADSDAATALFLYQRLRTDEHLETPPDAYLHPLVLHAFSDESNLTLDVILRREPLSSMAALNPTVFRAQVEVAIAALRHEGLLTGGDVLNLTARGSEQVRDVLELRSVQRDQAYGQFSAALRRFAPGLSIPDEQKAVELIENVMVSVFRKRGVAMANAIFADRPVAHDDLSEIFSIVFHAAAKLSEQARGPFADAVHEFLIYPTKPQREYLTALSQGFFLHHLLGLDPTCARIRLDIFKQTLWFFDSSMLIPFLAEGCYNHEFSKQLFSSLLERGARPHITKRMLVEVWEHLNWAIRFIRENQSVTPAFMAAALVKPGYKQNLFLDGYIRLSANGKVGTFEEYLNLVSPINLSIRSLGLRLLAAGLVVTDIATMGGYAPTDTVFVNELFDQIKQERVARDIYRSDEQVSAEAEVLGILKNLRSGRYKIGAKNGYERFYFVSQSNVLDKVSIEGQVITWTPEALYRYQSAIPKHLPNPDLLQQCMVAQYYQAGISFIDTAAYRRFFGSAIATAKSSFPEQKAKYVAAIEGLSSRDLEDAFEKTPDLEKPLFVARLNLRSIDAANSIALEQAARVRELEARVKQLETEKDKKWRATREKSKRQSRAEARKRTLPAKKKKGTKAKRKR